MHALGLVALLVFLTTPALADSIDVIAHWHVPHTRPLAHAHFCRDHPTWCGGLAQTKPIKATPDVLALLARVNREVNHRIKYRPDPKALLDEWSIDPPAGDCDDYSVSKLSALLKAGLPRSALRLAFYRMPSGVFHMVLTVETTAGTVVLSNLTDRVMPWREVPGAHWLGIERISKYGFAAFWELRE